MRSAFPILRPFTGVAGCALIFFAGPTAAAHEVKEMTAWARVFEDRVQVVITISAHMATVLLTAPNEPAASVSPESLPALQKRLEAQARAFCTLRSGGNEPLAPSLVDVVMTTPEELSFFITYPASAQPTLRFEMGVLDRLEPGNQVALVVLDAARKPIAGKMLTREEASLEIPLADKSDASPAPTATGKP